MQEPVPAAAAPPLTLTERVVGAPPAAVQTHYEVNGYVFWGAIALFIAVPEILAALSKHMKNIIPWPTISNLVGKDLESHHHWIALIVVGLIVLVALHTFTYPPQNKKLGQPVGPGAAAVPVVRWGWGWVYIVLTLVAGIAAGLVASASGADKNELGYTIYLTLVAFGVVIPSVFRHWRKEILAIPTLFATIALLREHRYCHWVAAAIVALLIVLCFHLALYPWPNYHFGTP
jgi:hypothetical protein